MGKKVLIGCEESQAVCKEFRKLGYEAYSCDLQECSGGKPEWHIVGDILEVVKGGWFSTEAGLWLKNLPKLQPVEIVEPEMYTYKSNGKRDPKWHVDTLKLPPEERRKARSKTYPGIAKAMAEQWSKVL